MEGISTEHQVATGPIRGEAPGLAGVKGRMLVTVGGEALGVVHVEDTILEMVLGAGEAEAAVTFDDRDDLIRMLRGELNPIVAILQDRMRVEGNVVLAAQVILGLRAGSSLKGERIGQER